MFNYETLVDPLLRDLRKFTPEFSGIKAGDKVIDVCCGTGAQVLEYGRCGKADFGILSLIASYLMALRKLRYASKGAQSLTLLLHRNDN